MPAGYKVGGAPLPLDEPRPLADFEPRPEDNLEAFNGLSENDINIVLSELAGDDDEASDVLAPTAAVLALEVAEVAAAAPSPPPQPSPPQPAAAATAAVDDEDAGRYLERSFTTLIDDTIKRFKTERLKAVEHEKALASDARGAEKARCINELTLHFDELPAACIKAFIDGGKNEVQVVCKSFFDRLVCAMNRDVV